MAINVENGKKVEVSRGEYGRKREHDCCVGYEPPLDAPLPATDGVEQRGHTLEEQRNDDS